MTTPRYMCMEVRDERCYPLNHMPYPIGDTRAAAERFQVMYRSAYPEVPTVIVMVLPLEPDELSALCAQCRRAKVDARAKADTPETVAAKTKSAKAALDSLRRTLNF